MQDETTSHPTAEAQDTPYETHFKRVVEERLQNVERRLQYLEQIVQVQTRER